MSFYVKEVDMSEIPDKKAFGAEETPRSRWCKELLDAFCESGAGIWELCEGMDGRFKTTREATSYQSSLKSQTKRKKYAGVQVIMRGRRLFLSKVKVMGTGDER